MTNNITKIIHIVFMALFSLNSYAQATADYVDFDIYPSEALNGKGVLYYNWSEINSGRKKFAVYVYDSVNNKKGVWKSDAASYFLPIDNIIDSGRDKLDNPQSLAQVYIIVSYMASEDGEYYNISSREGVGNVFLSLRVLKKDMEALGFQFIPLSKAVEICRNNLYWAKSAIRFAYTCECC